ncbi:hypothetical protein BU24DRAFT_473958 [Aaosphaeria arxii CBS 175.79]|uniref:Heterokaryon incompatibility domain-containing protein n=1 Tax=Aaosphaeria arxii CBS 175.79 TaxID=1450172 RepID=A0A6A5X9M8_9PLEO|nr:uncharacterized protein BU24DRAFT_473958 [Aaosphaeria arxii CBS 175.79]KAF2009755.1 hypothetical protein BU24DRAFT_473958 [Aaosphaeria arxii CBS 175.79]
MSSSRYPDKQPLRDDNIRLIRILPGNWEDEIRCDLYTESLSKRPKYHALSYVWGSALVKKPIKLNDSTFEATTNLESALRHLRHQRLGLPLWVDALSINQTDNQERTHQVQLMGNIYKSCLRVLVYLGDDLKVYYSKANPNKDIPSLPAMTAFYFNSTDRPYITRFLGKPSKAKVAQWRSELVDPMRDRTFETVQIFSFIRALSYMDHLSDLPILSPGKKNNFAESDLHHLFEILSRLMRAPSTKWWTRIWTVQEVVLPPEITLMCGTVSAPWPMFVEAAQKFREHILSCCSGIQSSLSKYCREEIVHFMKEVDNVEDSRTVYRHTAARSRSCDNVSILSYPDYSWGTKLSLLSIQIKFRRREASDARDKVYALLSLVCRPADQPAILPDYTLDISEVYTVAAVQCICDSRVLAILTAASMIRPCPKLPTWVPNWECLDEKDFGERLRMTGFYGTTPSLSRLPTMQYFSADRKPMLMLEGRCLDYVTHVGETITEDTLEDKLRSPLSWKDSKGNMHVMSNTHKTSEFWRVLCADIVWDDGHCRRATPKDHAKFLIWDIFSELSIIDTNMDSLSHLLSRSERLRLMLGALRNAEYISENNAGRVGMIFCAMFPDKAERQLLISKAFKTDVLDEGTETQKSLAAPIDISNDAVEEMPLSKGAGHSVLPLIPQDSLTPGQAQSGLELVDWVRMRSLVEGLYETKTTSGNTGSWDPLNPFWNTISSARLSVTVATEGRRIFGTKSGFIGLGPESLEHGDKLFLLNGGNTPFILREYTPEPKRRRSKRIWNKLKRPSAIEDTRNHYTFVGDCYVHGLMDAETLEENLISRDKVGVWQEISLL